VHAVLTVVFMKGEASSAAMTYAVERESSASAKIHRGFKCAIVVAAAAVAVVAAAAAAEQ
jgi:hypothetical protein